MADYTKKAKRENGEAAKKPSLIYRILTWFIPWKGDTIGIVVRKLIFIAALAVFIITAVPLLTDVLSMWKDQQESQKISQIYVPNRDGTTSQGTGTPTNPSKPVVEPDVPREVLSDFNQLLAANDETVGYLRIDGTMIDYPVVLTKDNDYYLDHDFYKRESRSGTIFMDYRCKITAKKEEQSDYMVMYGHNMAIGTFFSSLSEYWRTLHDINTGGSLEYYKKHPIISFDTKYEQADWKIFAIDLFNVREEYGEVYPYTNKQKFTSREDFNSFVIDIMDRSDILTDVDLQYGDDIIALSTCYWPFRTNMDNVRLVVFARKVRPGESRKVDVEKAKVNLVTVVRWKWVYENIGGGPKSVWDRRKLLSYTAEDAKKDGYVFLTD